MAIRLVKHDPLFVIPAKAGIQRTWGTGATENWIPAYAGMTDKGERLRPLIAAIAIFAALFVSPARADEVRLFAASSTAPLFEAFSDVFEKKTGHTLLVVSASSAILANQIVAGADADIFVSANTPWKDHVRERISVWLGDLPPYMGNRLVLVTPKNADVPVAPLTPEGFSTLVRNGPFVLCETQSAPCGIYAKQALESLGLWDIAKKGKVIQGANARATLAWLERGEADAGIIYASDAKFSNDLTVVAEIPADAHTPIIYELLIISPETPATTAFLEEMQGEDWEKMFTAFGFVPARSCKWTPCGP